MQIEKVVVGSLFTNCYILTKDNHVLIIDPGDEYNKIAESIGNKIIAGIIITHNHFDHIGALNKFDKKLVHDYHNLNEGINTIGKFIFEVIYTPGHKEDSISIYFDSSKCIFVGDFIFKNTIGRTDLSGGSMNDMLNSIRKTSIFDNDVIIYPGHGASTIFGYERKNNIYFNK